LISFGTDQAEPYRRAAGYVDRILKGEGPLNLPWRRRRIRDRAQHEDRQALGLDIPAQVLARADEVIE